MFEWLAILLLCKKRSIILWNWQKDAYLMAKRVPYVETNITPVDLVSMAVY